MNVKIGDREFKSLQKLTGLDLVEKTKKNIEKPIGRFSKAIVVFILLFVMLFSIAVLYVFLKTQKEPVVLIGAVLGFASTELYYLSGIKKKELEGEIEDDRNNVN